VIFVTVGTQLPFDRLVGAVDGWAADHPQVELFAQIGPGATPPAHVPYVDFVSPARADELMRSAQLIVAHAGMGSLLTAMGYGKPILIMPRKASLGEHRNEHQLATTRWMAQRPGVSVAWDESQVARRLDERDTIVSGASIPRFAHDAFVQRLRAEVLRGLGR
jgi:UDP-N-acetylglucosamine transferase subunit ALG13